jgi:hypothetical protein
MPDQSYQNAVESLNFAGISLTELPQEVGSSVNKLIIAFPDSEDQIIQLLPDAIRLFYLIGELESVIANDGLLSIFINYDKNQVDYLSLFRKARSLTESKYQLKVGISLADDLPEADIEEVFGLKVIDQIEAIEEKMNELQDNGKYWDKIEVIYKKSLKK